MAAGRGKAISFVALLLSEVQKHGNWPLELRRFPSEISSTTKPAGGIRTYP
jgi:hypothetical protein